ncbi:MAG TPA: arabinofuranosidase catalytic domain-containing protein [Polyangiaceae bacterium]|nr:arabinofuranosidase catalytic domain-containing protein [Polyangiaceae bacterium]
MRWNLSLFPFLIPAIGLTTGCGSTASTGEVAAGGAGSGTGNGGMTGSPDAAATTGSTGGSGSTGSSGGAGASTGSSGGAGASSSGIPGSPDAGDASRASDRDGSSGVAGSPDGGDASGASDRDGSSAASGPPPGDIANGAGVSVVAAHSMTRALFATYAGNLFQVSRASDHQKKDIAVTATGGTVDLATLDAFCASAACGVATLYDQTGNGNDLKQATQNNMPTLALWQTKGGSTLPYALTQNSGGPGAIGGDPTGQFLRNRTQTKKIPTGSAPQTEYMVVYAKYFKGHCCYDYGNMESGVQNDGPGTMNALYFGQTKDWTWGAASGPWGMVDMEDGVFSFGGNAGNVDPSNGNTDGQNTSDPAFAYPGTNVVAVLSKTNGTSTFALKAGDMEQGTGFATAWSGALPDGYAPLHQEGGLSLGEGGDGSDNVDGAFFEGFVVAGEESDTADTALQTNLHAFFTQ